VEAVMGTPLSDRDTGLVVRFRGEATDRVWNGIISQLAPGEAIDINGTCYAFVRLDCDALGLGIWVREWDDLQGEVITRLPRRIAFTDIISLGVW